MRALVVEDEVIVARYLQLMLESLGYQVVGTAASADEALALAERHRPHLALLDVTIRGGRDGIALAAEIRDRFRIPFVFITSHADPATLARATQVRPSAYLVKPVTKDNVYAATELALSNHAEEQAPPGQPGPTADGDVAALEAVAGAATSPAGVSGGLPPLTLRRVIDYIEAGFARDLTLAELAAVAGMTQYHFARRFKESAGVAPHQYVVRRRIEEAKRLLEHSDVPVSEVGFTVGYESQGYFTTLFGRTVGTTPAAYRRARR